MSPFSFRPQCKQTDTTENKHKIKTIFWYRKVSEIFRKHDGWIEWPYDCSNKKIDIVMEFVS